MQNLFQSENRTLNQHRKIELKKILLTIILGMAVQMVASFVLTIVLGWFPDTAKEYEDGIEKLIQISAGMIIMVCVMMPVLEELVFRGIILNLLKRIAPFFVANITQALAFGIYHGNIVQGIYAFILGMFIGFIYKLTGNIVYTCVLHMSINTLGIFINKLVPEDTLAWLKVILAITAFLTIIGIVFLFSKESEIEDRATDSK